MRTLSLLALVAAGCTQSSDPCSGQVGACLAIHLQGSVAALDQVRVNLSGFASDSFTRDVPNSSAPLPAAIGVLLPAAGGTETVSVAGLSGGAVVAFGSNTIALAAQASGVIDVQLAAADASMCGGTNHEIGQSDVGCGGPACAPCGEAKTCISSIDCQLADCGGGTCALFKSPAGSTYSVGSSPMWIAAGVLEIGKPLDLVATTPDGVNGGLSILFGAGDGTFMVGPEFRTMHPATSLALADLYGTGKADAVTLSATGGLIVYQSNFSEDGGWAGANALEAPVGLMPSALTVASFDGGMSMQVFAATPQKSEVAAYFFERSGLSAEDGEVPGCDNPVAIGNGFFNHDTYRDVVLACVAGDGTGQVSFLLGQDDGKLNPKVVTVSTGSAVVPTGVTVGDFNGDGYDDLALVTSGTMGAVVEMNAQSADPDTVTLKPASHVGTVTGVLSIATADLDGDGYLDLVLVSSNGVELEIGDGHGDFFAATKLAAVSQPSSVVIADFNGDKRPDLAMANTAANTISVLLNQGQR